MQFSSLVGMLNSCLCGHNIESYQSQFFTLLTLINIPRHYYYYYYYYW